MTKDLKNREELLSAWILGDLEGPEADEIQRLVATDTSWSREAAEIRQLLHDVRDIVPSDPGEIFFKRQANCIHELLQKEAMGGVDLDNPRDLISAWVLGDLDEATTDRLSSIIENNDDFKKEAQEIRQLLGKLKSVEVEDPGDLFFMRQRARIREKISEAGSSAWLASFWKGSYALAVAAVLLIAVVGLFKFSSTEMGMRGVAWQAAMERLAVEEDDTGMMPDLEELSDASLTMLASRMELDEIRHDGDELLERAVDLEDLNDSELERLIKGMEG